MKATRKEMIAGKKNRKRVSKKLVLGVTVSFVIVSYFLTVVYVDAQLAKRSYPEIINSCNKVWATRGLVTDHENRLNNANSIESVTLALQSGAIGVEIDVYFDLDIGDYVVSHDRPYNLKDGHILTLKELFQSVKYRGYYWLDFKKMTRLNETQMRQAVERLQDITIDTGLSSRVYVESEHPKNVAFFHRGGFHSILDTQPLPDSYIGTELIHNVYKIIFYFGNFSVMGIGYGELDDPVFNSTSYRVLKDVPIFVYHVPNDEVLILNLAAQKNVRVILNSDETVNMFSINSCQSISTQTTTDHEN